MIVIKNLKIDKPVNSWDVKVDRSCILGNPFAMKSEYQRDYVCDCYATYFENKMVKDEQFCVEVERLIDLYRYYKKLNLFCWCVPKRCHAETIKAYIEKVCEI